MRPRARERLNLEVESARVRERKKDDLRKRARESLPTQPGTGASARENEKFKYAKVASGVMSDAAAAVYAAASTAAANAIAAAAANAAATTALVGPRLVKVCAAQKGGIEDELDQMCEGESPVVLAQEIRMHGQLKAAGQSAAGTTRCGNGPSCPWLKKNGGTGCR